MSKVQYYFGDQKAEQPADIALCQALSNWHCYRQTSVAELRALTAILSTDPKHQELANLLSNLAACEDDETRMNSLALVASATKMPKRK